MKAVLQQHIVFAIFNTLILILTYYKPTQEETYSQCVRSRIFLTMCSISTFHYIYFSMHLPVLQKHIGSLIQHLSTVVITLDKGNDV